MSTRVGVSACYAAQGFGYATVVTALPAFKQRYEIDDGSVTLVILTVCALAAAGSVLTERIALRRGSATALIAGLATQSLAFVLIATAALASAVPLAAFWVAFALFGLGLGMVDAGAGIQGVLVERRRGSTVMAGFFACTTGAAIVGALGMAALRGAGSPDRAGLAVAVAALVTAGVAVAARGRLVPVDLPLAADPVVVGQPVVRQPAVANARLPRWGIAAVGSVVLAAFVVDSAVSSWSTVLLSDELLAGAGVAPLGYAAYQAVVLVTRLVGDRLVDAVGRAVPVLVASLLAAAGLVAVALVPAPAAVIVGFAVAGVGVGVLVPAAFSAAGGLVPHRVDEVVARVNLFNYGGAVLGAGLVGALAGGIGLATAFLAPAVLLAVIGVVVSRSRHLAGDPAAPGGPQPVRSA